MNDSEYLFLSRSGVAYSVPADLVRDTPLRDFPHVSLAAWHSNVVNWSQYRLDTEDVQGKIFRRLQ